MAVGEDVYCTLVMSDSYLPGAAVLAKSLRDAGTQKKLACMVVQESLKPTTVEELQSLYNYVIPVAPIASPSIAALYLMRRPDLHQTFTKIHLWRFTQFRRIVYIDADIVVLRAPDELFDLDDQFAAAPDVGFPDCFNTGVFSTVPNQGTFEALRTMAAVGDSFDGADQGLLNQYFEHKPWKRLSFTYNCAPSAHYQYEPAYRYYKRDISLVHFLGPEKPWQKDRSGGSSSAAYQELLSRWWAVYDRHFKVSTADYISGLREQPQSGAIQQEVRGQGVTVDQGYYATGYPIASTSPAPPPQVFRGPAPPPYEHPRPAPPPPQPSAPVVLPEQHFNEQREGGGHVDHGGHHEHHHGGHQESHHGGHPETYQENHPGHHHGNDHGHHHGNDHGHQPGNNHEHHHGNNHERSDPPPPVEVRQFSAPQMEWDATRDPPPFQSRPEASSFPTTTYEFSTDTKQYRPPTFFSERPREPHYETPQPAPQPQQHQPPPPPEKLTPIFPWEERPTPKPTRKFIEDEPLLPPPPPPPEPESQEDASQSGTDSEDRSIGAESTSPTTPIFPPSQSPWELFDNRSKNAWDDVTGIDEYVRALTVHQKYRGKVQVLSNNNATGQQPPEQTHILSPTNGPNAKELIEKVQKRRESLLLTDFPTAIERPSLPVTPAPVRRSTFWGGASDGEDQFTAAEGVPNQEDWDPSAQLEQLRRNSLIGVNGLMFPDGKSIPNRAMPPSATVLTGATWNYPHIPLSGGGSPHGLDALGEHHHPVPTADIVAAKLSAVKFGGGEPAATAQTV